jgi:NADH-quinone oxidoreductase subunit N
MIYGMSMLYVLTGTTNISMIGNILRSHMITGAPETSALIFVSTLMILVGFGFKIAMVPFHQWSPDIYEGAPTPITAFLSVGSKAAGFAVLMRVLATTITADNVFDWTPLIIVLSGITMTVGNLVAIPQGNIKRMLAYSSIAQAGYMLLGVAALGVAGSAAGRTYAIQAVLLYSFAYLFMNLGALSVITKSR